MEKNEILLVNKFYLQGFTKTCLIFFSNNAIIKREANEITIVEPGGRSKLRESNDPKKVTMQPIIIAKNIIFLRL